MLLYKFVLHVFHLRCRRSHLFIHHNVTHHKNRCFHCFLLDFPLSEHRFIYEAVQYVMFYDQIVLMTMKMMFWSLQGQLGMKLSCLMIGQFIFRPNFSRASLMTQLCTWFPSLRIGKFVGLNPFSLFPSVPWPHSVPHSPCPVRLLFLHYLWGGTCF